VIAAADFLAKNARTNDRVFLGKSRNHSAPSGCLFIQSKANDSAFDLIENAGDTFSLHHHDFSLSGTALLSNVLQTVSS